MKVTEKETRRANSCNVNSTMGLPFLLKELRDVFFNGNTSKELNIIDTIGFDDPSNDLDATIIADLVTTLKNNVDFINTFVIAVNGQNPRLDGALLAMIRILHAMFGDELWKQTVVIFTRLPMNKFFVQMRESTNIIL